MDAHLDRDNRLALGDEPLRLVGVRLARVVQPVVDVAVVLQLLDVLGRADDEVQERMPHRRRPEILEREAVGHRRDRAQVRHDLVVAGEHAVGADVDLQERRRRRDGLGPRGGSDRQHERRDHGGAANDSLHEVLFTYCSRGPTPARLSRCITCPSALRASALGLGCRCGARSLLRAASCLSRFALAALPSRRPAPTCPTRPTRPT